MAKLDTHLALLGEDQTRPKPPMSFVRVRSRRLAQATLVRQEPALQPFSLRCLCPSPGQRTVSVLCKLLDCG